MVNQDNSRLERLLRGINTEVKLLALLALDKERPQTGFDIRRQLRERIDDDSLVPAQNSFETVCRDCLRPSGAVQETKKVSGTGKRQKEVKSYALTELGEHLFQPVAGFVLNYVASKTEGREEPDSIYSILGFSSSKGVSCAPLNRFLLLEALANETAITETQLARNTGLKISLLSKHLRSLHDLGYLEFRSVGKNGDRDKLYKFEAVETDSPLPRADKIAPTLIAEVYKILKDEEKAVIKDIVPRVRKSRETVGRVLASLISSGHVKRAEGPWAVASHSSEIKPLMKTTNVACELLFPIRNAVEEGPWLNNMRDNYLAKLQKCSDLFQAAAITALNKYNQVSSHKNAWKPEQALIEIRAKLIRAGGKLTLAELARELTLSRSSAQRYTSILERNGVLTSGTNEHGERFYTLS